MSEKLLRNTFLVGTVFFLAVLGAMTLDSLGQMQSKRTPPVTAQVENGKHIWQAKNCNDCHTILGIGGYYAPELTKVAQRRGPQWLQAFLKSPRSVITQATMPDQRLSDAEASDLVAFFAWVGDVNTNNWPPQPLMAASGGSANMSGEWLFTQKGCGGCHTVNGKGAAGPGPDLSKIASQPFGGLPNDSAGLHEYLENPKLLNPNGMMPAIPMSDAERDAIVTYLLGLK